MIKVYNNPFLLDFVKAAINMPEDERQQVQAFSGEPYDIDGVAVGNFTVPGPKWVIKDDDLVLAVGGFVPRRPGVWKDFMLTTAAAWERGFAVTRICKRVMDAMFISGQAHRLECIVPASRLESRKELAKWYKVLGYHEEGVRYGYCADGQDAISFARVKH